MGFGGQRGYPGGGGAAGGYDKGHGGAVGGGGYDKGHGGGRGGGFGGGEGRGSGKGSSSSYSHGPPAPPAPPPAPVGYGGYHGSSSSTRGGGGYSSGSTSYGRPAGAGGGSEGYSGYSGSAGGHHSSGSYGSGAGAGGYSHGDRGGGSSYGERGSPPLRLVTPGPCGGAPPRGARRSRSREQTRGPPRLITPGPCGGGPPARGRRSLSRGYTAAAVGAPPRRRSHSRDYGGLPPRGAPPNSRRSPSWDYGSRGHSKDQRTAFPGWKDAGQRGFSQDFGPEEDFAPQPVEEEDGPVADLTVAGCQHDTVAEIVTGDFVQSGINHGRPVYKKKDQVNGTDVLLYFWDDRDGVKYSGWWFGPKVGGEQIWAYHPEREELSPPAYGWQVPFDGPVDQGFTVSMRLATAPPPQSSQSSQSYGGGMMEDKRDLGRRREEEWPPRQEELDWRRRDVNRRRQEEEQRRREDEKRQFEMEMERKRLQQQGQQRAILAIRRCIQKVRSATAETFDDSKRELEEMLHHELDNTGSQRDRIWQESSEGIDQGRRRVEMEYTRNLQKQEYEEKQRKMAEQRRIVEELKKKQWEENERKRREAEKKQKEEEEQKKKEQQQKRIEENRAVLEIRKTMQRIRMAVSKEETEKPDYAELQASLEAVLKEQLNKTGGMKDKLQDESKLEIEKLKMRLDLQGKEKEKKEAAVQILKDLEELLETAEANVQKYASSLDSLSAKGETTVMDVEESVEAVRPLKTSAQNSTNACTQFVKNKSWEVSSDRWCAGDAGVCDLKDDIGMFLDPTKPSPLSLAVRSGDVAEVTYLLRARADPNRRDETGESCLFEAAVIGSFEKAAALLLAGCDARHKSNVDGAMAADLSSDDHLASTLRAFAGSGGDSSAFRTDSIFKESFGESYSELLEHLDDLEAGKVDYGEPFRAHLIQSAQVQTGGKPQAVDDAGGQSNVWVQPVVAPGSLLTQATFTSPRPFDNCQKMDCRPEDDHFDWGRVLWDPDTERAAFRVAPQRGTVLQMAMLQGDILAPPASGVARLLQESERVNLALDHFPPYTDSRGVRWVRTVVESDERQARQLGAEAPALPTWWTLWSDLELVPAGIVSAAHDEARMDDLMTKTERRGEQMSDEEYQRAWWHRMGVDMGGLGGATAGNWKLKGYVNRVRSVVGVREVRGSRNRRARSGGRGQSLSSAASGGLPPDFYSGDWSDCPTARAMNPGTVKGRVSVVCPTCESRQHFHELLYRNFCAQRWSDKELIVLDTGGSPSPFFTGEAQSANSLLPHQDPRVLYVHMRKYPLTLGHKRNQLMQLASGEIVAHFDDDNLYAPQYLAVMVEQLRVSRAQLVRLEATFSWNPVAGALLWHDALAFRAETFVHWRGPLCAIAFAHAKCGEEGGLGAVCIIHDLDDTYGVFMHVEHGANVSCCSKVGDAWLKGVPVRVSDIPNPELRTMMAESEHFYGSGRHR